MLPATPQRTADNRLPAPAPITAPGDDLRGREREPVVRGREDHRGARPLRGEALRSVHLDDPSAHRPDDPPAARSRCRARSQRPPRSRPSSGGSDPSERLPFAIRARAITPIVFCASLVPWASASIPPETICPSRNPRVTGPGRWRADHPVADDDRDPADDERDHGCDHGGDQHLVEDALTQHRVGADGRKNGADDAADQRVRRARGEPVVPGDQVPGDRPDQPGEDHERRDRPGVDDVGGDRRGHLERDEGADEVQDRGVA